MWREILRKVLPFYKGYRRYDIFDFLPKNAICAEIGVFKGDFSKHILKYSKPKKVHFIDGWWEMYGEYFPDLGSYTDYGNLKTKEAYNTFLRNIEKFKNISDIQIHVGDDLKILQESPDNYFDWVYLDSSHEYEHTHKELLILKEKVKPSGIIAGHDYIEDPTHIHYGVKKALDEFCKTYHYELIYRDDFTQWGIKKVNH